MHKFKDKRVISRGGPTYNTDALIAISAMVVLCGLEHVETKIHSMSTNDATQPSLIFIVEGTAHLSIGVYTQNLKIHVFSVANIDNNRRRKCRDWKAQYHNRFCCGIMHIYYIANIFHKAFSGTSLAQWRKNEHQAFNI